MYRNALFFSLLEKNTNLIVRFVASIFLARLLTPTDFGDFAIATAFIFFAETIQQTGIPNYIIKEKNITREKLSSAFTIMSIMALLLGTLLILSSTLIARFYRSDTLESLLVLLALLLFVSPFSVLERSLLRKKLDFKTISKIDMISVFFSNCIAVTLAFYDYGVTSLAWGLISCHLIAAFLFYMKRPNEDRYSLSFYKVKEITNFIYPLLGSTVIAQLGNMLPRMVVGRIFSQASLGVYARAQSTADLFGSAFTQGIRLAIAPIFANIKNTNNDIRAPIKKMISVQCTFGWPFYFLLAYYSELIIVTLYGEQWRQSIGLVWVFCLSQSFLMITVYFTDVLEGLGHSHLLLKVQFYLQILRIGCLMNSYIFYSDTLFSFVLSFVFFFSIIRLTFMTWLAKNYLSFNVADIIKAVLSPLVITFLFSSVFYLGHVMLAAFQVKGSLASEILILLSAIVVFLISTCFLNSIIRDEIKLFIRRYRDQKLV